MEKVQFKVWKTILIGTHKSAYALSAEIKHHRFIKTSVFLNEIDLDDIPVSSEEKFIDLVFLHPEDLGIVGNSHYNYICQKAKEFGLDICPKETGLQIAQQRSVNDDEEIYKNFPIIASETIETCNLDLSFLRYLVTVNMDDDGKTINVSAKDVQYDYLWHDKWPFIFVKPKDLKGKE